MHIKELAEQLEAKEEEVEKIRSDLKHFAQTSKSVRDIIDQVRCANVYGFLLAITLLIPSIYRL